LAAEQPLDAVRVRNFINRMKGFIISNHLKGFDDVVWYAEALECLARKP
jgi:hypothetical protein